jgi:hypothetical protein
VVQRCTLTHQLNPSVVTSMADSIKVVINGARSTLCKGATKDCKLSVATVRAFMGLKEDQTPDLQACLSFHLPGGFLIALLDSMNRAYAPQDLITPIELEVFLNVLILLHVFRCSPDFLFRELERGEECMMCNPAVRNSLLESGAENVFKRCLAGISYSRNSEHGGTSWAESQTFDDAISSAAQCT